MTTAAFAKQGTPIVFDKGLGLCFGWFCFSKKGGEDYVDAHGDHFPDDELVAAVDGLMAQPIEKRTINIEHAGPGRGVICTAQAMTEDVAKALRIDTGGTYGVLGSFRPDDGLMKSIRDGKMFCLSIEGTAADVEVISKSADGAAEVEKGCKPKRIMRKVSLTKLAVVEAGAHAGAEVALVKSARPALARLAKRMPGLTSMEHGHQHIIYDVEEPDGRTSYECGEGDPEGCGHSHVFVRLADGSLAIGATAGHTHTLAASSEATETEPMSTDLAASLAKTRSLLAVALALSPEQAAFAKSLAPDSLEAFLAKSDTDRAKLATPIHKSERLGRSYYAGQESLVEVVKDADAMHERVAKAEATAETARFEKRAAAEIPNLAGSTAVQVAVLKAIDALPEETRKGALEMLKSANAAMGTLGRAPDFGGVGEPIAKGALAAYDEGLAEFAKSKGKKPDAVADEFLDTPDGQRLYAAYKAEHPSVRRA